SPAYSAGSIAPSGYRLGRSGRAARPTAAGRRPAPPAGPPCWLRNPGIWPPPHPGPTRRPRVLVPPPARGPRRRPPTAATGAPPPPPDDGAGAPETPPAYLSRNGHAAGATRPRSGRAGDADPAFWSRPRSGRAGGAARVRITTVPGRW